MTITIVTTITGTDPVWRWWWLWRSPLIVYTGESTDMPSARSSRRARCGGSHRAMANQYGWTWTVLDHPR